MVPAVGRDRRTCLSASAVISLSIGRFLVQDVCIVAHHGSAGQGGWQGGGLAVENEVERAVAEKAGTGGRQDDDFWCLGQYGRALRAPGDWEHSSGGELHWQIYGCAWLSCVEAFPMAKRVSLVYIDVCLI